VDSGKTILLLDDDEQSAHDIQRFLKVSAFTFQVSHASDIAEGMNYLKNRKPDLVLLDSDISKAKDFPLFKTFVEREKIPFILLSESSEGETRRQAESTGADDYLQKNKINLFHLQKSIVNALKLNEVEIKLDDTFNEFVSQHDSLYKLLNKLDEGVLVVNSHNAIRYANTKAYTILSDESIRKHLSDILSYRENEDEEKVELKHTNNFEIKIRISDVKWNGEKANLFILEKVKVAVSAEKEILNSDTFISLMNTLPGNFVLLKADRVEFANRSALKLLKQKSDDLRQKNIHDIFQSKDPLLADISIQSFLSERYSEGVIKYDDGTEQQVTFNFKPINVGDDFFHLLTFEKQVVTDYHFAPQSRSDEDKFSTEDVLHLASHDLREPVRTILNYVQLISDNLHSGKYKEATEYADFAKSAAGRMEKLLNDLKIYIALNEHQYTIGKVSMKLAVTDALKSMKSTIEESGAEITVAELPDVNADRDLVEKVISHLVDNAIKFAKKGRKPTIDIGFDMFEGNLIFCVRDNGIGISKKYYKKIFELFERLNRVDEYPGNGLGLAICKKIIDIHGGDIWVESLPGSGSNFYFTLRGK
jgi:signal transduction histidine kinase/CheY-like chemotaxis protein